MTLPSDPPDKDALISALMARIEALVEQNAQLTARIAELEATLGLPPKTPDNSSTPPSKGQKPSGPSAAKAKANPHAGAHRLLHPNPTATRDVFAATCRGCGADVSGAPQRVCESYGRIEIPASRPDVTAGVARHSDWHQTEFFLTTLVRLCRSLTGMPLTPLSVTISHARSEGLAEYNRFFGCQPEFAAQHDGVVFRDECRRLPIVSADPHLSDILVGYCEETLASRRSGARSSFRASVENVIAPLLPHGKPQAQVIARKLNLSPRTLARRLADEGLGFASCLRECGGNSQYVISQTPGFRSPKWRGCLGSKRRPPSPTPSGDGQDRRHPRYAARSHSQTASPPARARQPAPIEPANLATVGRLIDEPIGGAHVSHRDQPVHVAIALRIPLFPMLLG